jgi:hypothetical protein
MRTSHSFMAADGAGWAVFGTVVGLACVTVPIVGLVRTWPASRTWLALLGVLVVDVVALVLIVS